MATTHTGTGSTSGTRGTAGSGLQSATGQTQDTTYDLISVMYHTLHGCQTYERYAQDAEQAGQQDVAQFFRDTGREFERCAQRGQQLLAQCLQQGQGPGGGRSAQLSSQNVGSQAQQGSGSMGSSSGSMGGSSSSGTGSSRGSGGTRGSNSGSTSGSR